VRNIWTDGHVERGPGDYRAWSAEIAKAEGVRFLDVSSAIADRYEAMGQEKVKDLFPLEHTHSSQAGADLNASLVVAALKGLKDCPVIAYLSAKGNAIPGYPALLDASIARLNLPTPANPDLPTLFLIGDSTVRNGRGDGSNGQWGWGEPLVEYFDPAKINVVNRAVGGLSQPDLSDAGTLGPCSGDAQAGRFRDDAVRSQRFRTSGRTGARPRHASRDGRGDQGDRQPHHQAA
jgi:hypothetical protein